MMLAGFRSSLALLAVLAAMPAGRAQLVLPQKGETLPSFEVATIKPSSKDLGRSFHVSIWENDNSYRTENTTLRDLIRAAFDAHSAAQITGGSDALLDARWDINAKIGDDDWAHLKTLSPEEQNRAIALMLQSLLADRFGLKVHVETRELPVFNLVVGKGGAKLQASVAPEAPAASSGASGMHGPAGGAAAKTPSRDVSTHVSHDEGRMTASYATPEDLATMLGRQPEVDGRTVIDATGLTGKYNWTLEWHRLSMNSADSDTTLPSLFSALKEQLGLSLESGKGPVQIVVVDAIGAPTAN